MPRLPMLVPALLVALAGAPATLAAAADQAAVIDRSEVAEPAALIEVAILLDTSGSMDGLIDQARARLWSIVNDLATTTRNGQAPDLRVAVYEYGNSGLSADSHYIRQVLPLSADLDAVSEALFALTTNGGDEYCGAVIGAAVDELAWAAGDHYRAIFIAGNEPFTQGPVAYRETCAEAIGAGIVVNTIHCGSEADARRGEWYEAASLADGRALVIDHNRVEVAIVAPQDERIAALNRALNETYLAYGQRGRELSERQVAQDANALQAAPAAAADRAAAKASDQYRNAEWDLVDAVAEGAVELEQLEPAALPEELRELDPEERAAHVAARAAERERIQAELRALVAERAAHVAAERARRGADDAGTFGAVVRETLRDQLTERGYQPAE